MIIADAASQAGITSGRGGKAGDITRGLRLALANLEGSAALDVSLVEH